MATFLDVGLLRYFNVIFPFIFVWAIVFALFQKTKIIGDKVGVNSLIAVAVAFMVSLSDSAVQMINFMIPWFTIAIIFFLLLILVFQVFGAGEKDIFKALQGDKSITWVIIGVALVIALAAFSNVFGQQLTQAAFQGGQSDNVTSSSGVASANFQSNIYATLFHPKVLGMVVLFAIAIFAIALLSQG